MTKTNLDLDIDDITIATKDNKNNNDNDNNNDILKNEFYLYDDITNNTINNILKAIKNAHKRWNDFLFEFNDFVETAVPKPIKIFINSNGGDIFAAIPLIDAIQNSKIPIETYVEGIAASAASLISIVGHKRFITKNSFMLIHELRSGIEGTYSDIIEEKDNCSKIMKIIKNIYLDKTSGKLTNTKLNKILKKDILLSSKECLQFGFIDQII